MGWVGCGLRVGREGSGNGLWAIVELIGSGVGHEEEEMGCKAVGNSEPKVEVLGRMVDGCGPNMDMGGNMVEGCGPKRDL